MKTIIRLKKIIALVKKYEKKRVLEQKDMYIINRAISKLDKDDNFIRHYQSRLERVKLKFLQE